MSCVAVYPLGARWKSLDTKEDQRACGSLHGIWNLNRGVHVKRIRVVILNEGDVAEGVIEKNSAIILAIEFRSEIWMAMGKLEIALKPFELDAREMGIIERSLDGSI